MTDGDGQERSGTGRPPVLVSACLLGLACRYDGAAKRNDAALSALSGRSVVPVCPETAAGLGVPRPAFEAETADIDRVLQRLEGLPNVEGVDVAPRLVPACVGLAEVARSCGAAEAILKERSPSCGVNQIYVNGELRPGRGVLAELLHRAGVSLRSEEDLPGGKPRREGEQN